MVNEFSEFISDTDYIRSVSLLLEEEAALY